jgi:hypothetical protein
MFAANEVAGTIDGVMHMVNEATVGSPNQYDPASIQVKENMPCVLVALLIYFPRPWECFCASPFLSAQT